MKNSDWYLYILECRDGSYYTGVTTNIPERLERHNSGKGAKYTRSRRPCRLVYFEKPTAESTARQREYEIKKLKHYQKEELICRFSKTALKTILKKDES